ncbi:hypothetical protein NIES4074_61290 (plasmid) [Cylindrospermum sp. NIES-4074]|nr:hypothetical protein NIES4074_61290 [Cylindrospermum sp. NIES-4074]
MKCPSCGSSETYRKAKHSLIVNCDRCRHIWEVNQVAFPIAQFRLYKSKGAMRGNHYIDVWLCPSDKSKFSFSLRYQSSFNCIFPNPDYPEDPYLKGMFDNPQLAIEAGIKQVYQE